MKKTKTSHAVLGIVLGVAIGIITLFTIFFALVFLFFMGGPAKTYKDIQDYPKIFNENGIRTGYITFPEEIPEGTLETEFYHKYRDTLFSPTVQTYLKCKYTDVAFKKEILRLENTSKTYGNRKEVLKRDDEGKYNYPAYIAVENAADTYEYALITGDNEIVYIFTMYGDEVSLGFDKKYLPSDYMTEEGKEFGSGFSIYYATVSKDSISEDYSRDPNPEVRSGHSVIIGDDMVVVGVKLTSEGREEIVQVSYFKDSGDIKNGTETEYHDLDGTIFVDLKADYDNYTATLSYEENGVTKTKIYP